MKLLIGIVVSILVGAGCRFFDIPAPSPSAIPGAVLVIATTLGYTSMNRFLERRGRSQKIFTIAADLLGLVSMRGRGHLIIRRKPLTIANRTRA